MKTSPYKIELAKVEELEKNLETLNDIDLESAFLSLCGGTLIQIQISEYAMLGLIAHLKEELLESDRSFRDLNSQRFISNDPDDKEYRKQTLGTIIRFLKNNVKLFSVDDLNSYLDNRNDFIHNFWRLYLSNNREKIRSEKLKAFKFVISVYKDSIKWTSIFKGFIYACAVSIATKNGKSIDPFKSLQEHYQTFLDSTVIRID